MVIPTSEDLSSQITTRTSKGWPHHRGLRRPLFLNIGGGSFTSNKNQMSKSAVREDLRFFVLIREKIRESNRLKMSLQRHYVLSSELFKELGKSATNALCLLKRDDRFLSASMSHMLSYL